MRLRALSGEDEPCLRASFTEVRELRCGDDGTQGQTTLPTPPARPLFLQTLRLEGASPSNNTEFGDNGSGSSSSSGSSTGSPESEDTYVMWMGAGEANGTFGLSAVATSGHPDGPFSLRRTLYPDGNETHDQTVYIGERTKGVTPRLTRLRQASSEKLSWVPPLAIEWCPTEKRHPFSKARHYFIQFSAKKKPSTYQSRG